jgi:hypothetical protein
MIGDFENLLQDTKNFAEKQVFAPLKAKINIGKYLHFSYFFRTFELPIRDYYFYSYQLLFLLFPQICINCAATLHNCVLVLHHNQEIIYKENYDKG